MKNNPILHAVATIKGSNQTSVISRTYYGTKTEFKGELKANGYIARVVFSDADYDKVMEKIKTKGLFSLSKTEDLIYDTVNNFGSLEEMQEISTEGAIQS